MSLVRLADNRHRDIDFPLEESYVRELWRAEDEHFWHTQRNEWILRALRHHGLARGSSVLEVGCGSGGVSRAMERAGYRVTGVDTAEPLLEKAVERCPRATFVAGDVGTLPAELQGPYDAVALLDVLEHLDEPLDLLGKTLRWLAPGGLVLATVPARRSLFSRNDELWGHKTRFESGELTRLLERADLREVHEHGIFRAIVPAMWLARRGDPAGAGTPTDPAEHCAAMRDSVRVPAWPVNAAFALLCRLERWLGWGLSGGTAGSSILAVARSSGMGACEGV